MATFDFRRFRWALTAIPVTSFRHNAQHCSAWSILHSHGCHGASRTARVISENGYFLRLLICLAALLALRIAAIYAAKIDLVLDEAQY
jgi:hypothetical protein